MMNKIFVVVACILLSSRGSSSPVEDSVVSVYTTQSTTAGTNAPLDVYSQIANNIAERITSPIYRFLGFNKTTTAAPATKQTWHQLEDLDEQDSTTKQDLIPIDNEIESKRDVEELSPDVTTPQKKPEKITLYSSLTSSYLPAKLEENNTKTNEVDFGEDSLELDNVELDDPRPVKSRESPFIYVMELLGSIFQLVWGGITSLFKPSGKR